MKVEIGPEAALFPEKEYINGIFVAVWSAIYSTGSSRGRQIPWGPAKVYLFYSSKRCFSRVLDYGLPVGRRIGLGDQYDSYKKTVDYLLVGWPTAVRSSCAPPGREWGLFCRSRGPPWWAHLWQLGTTSTHVFSRDNLMAWDWTFFLIILKLKGTVPRLHIFLESVSPSFCVSKYCCFEFFRWQMEKSSIREVFNILFGHLWEVELTYR
jgi:hypothetical protein